MKKTIKRRFIAGAACPKCFRIDKTVVYDDARRVTSECIACGFTQHMPKPGADNESFSPEENP